jgi:hypothetical protein
MATPVKTTSNFNCYLIGTQISHPDYEEPETIVETWQIKVKESAFSIVNPEVVYEGLVDENAVPAWGETFTSWCSGRSPAMTPAYGWGDAYCIGVEYSKNKDGSVIAQISFSNRKKQTNTQTGATQNYFPVSVEAASQQRETVLFKRNWAAGPPSGSDQSAAISGDNIASNPRDGMPYYINQVRYRVRRAFDSKTHSLMDVTNHFSAHVGKRNELTFMNNLVGSMEFEGFNVVKLEGPFYEIVFDFIYDEHNFHSQTVGLAPDGLPTTDATGLNPTDVRWTRPTKLYFDFNTVCWTTTLGTADANLKAIMQRGYWVNP